jgi:hypothetical protein
MIYSPTNAVETECCILKVSYMMIKCINVSVNSGQKSGTTIARTWTEEGDKCAEHPVASIQNTKETRWH